MAKKKAIPLVEKAFDYERVVRDAAQYAMVTKDIPKIVNDELKKSWRQLPNTDPTRSPKSWSVDPLSLQYSLGYKDRKSNLNFATLKKVVQQLSVLNGIINLRCSQVAEFSEPYRKTRGLGFAIKHKDPDHATTAAEVAFIKELEHFIVNCGRKEKNPYSVQQRDSFNNFLRKIVRDSLTIDNTAFEVVPDQLGIPFEFYAVDGSTIFHASESRYVGVNSSYHSREGFVPGVPTRFAGLYEGREYGQLNTASGEAVKYVQIINGQIENVYSENELAFGIRNPRTDLYASQYGQSEVEMLINVITSQLYAEEWNRNIFKHGSHVGILNFKGDNFTPDQLEQFRSHWHAQVAGVENSHKNAILQSEGVEWIDLQRSNQEMGFSQWIEWLLKNICSVFLVDPSELGFEVKSGVSQTPLFESAQEWKLKASRDKGLKPLLKFLAHMINKNIIDRIDDHFTFEFVGLDEPTQQEQHELLIEQLSSYRTLNEIRKEKDLPELEGGGVPLNPTYLQALQISQASKQMQAQGQIQSPEGPEGLPEAGNPKPNMLAGSSSPEEVDTTPRYSDAFNMDSE